MQCLLELGRTIGTQVDRNHGGNDLPQLSGASMEDVLSYAHELHVKQPGKKFELDHWWRLLRDQPKWRSLIVTHLKEDHQNHQKYMSWEHILILLPPIVASEEKL